MLRLGCKSEEGICPEQVLKADHFINANYSYLNPYLANVENRVSF
jgi:hypothetical protein